MSPIESVCLLAGVGYAVYCQTQVQERTGRGRFKRARPLAATVTPAVGSAPDAVIG